MGNLYTICIPISSNLHGQQQHETRRHKQAELQTRAEAQRPKFPKAYVARSSLTSLASELEESKPQTSRASMLWMRFCTSRLLQYDTKKKTLVIEREPMATAKRRMPQK